MRAELYHNEFMVAFVWGENCDVANGRVRVYEYTDGKPRYDQEVQTYNADYARGYWRKLIKLGYRRQCSNMPFVPRTDAVSTSELLNAFEESC